MRVTLVSIACAIAACAATPALAGDINCVWRALPDGAGEKLMAAIDNRMEPDFGLISEDEGFQEQAFSCLPRADNDRQQEAMINAMFYALTGALYERSAERWLLEDDDGKVAKALQAGWSALSVRERDRLGSLKTLGGQRARAAIVTAIQATGYTASDNPDEDEQTFATALSDYFIGRAMREYYEAKF